MFSRDFGRPVRKTRPFCAKIGRFSRPLRPNRFAVQSTLWDKVAKSGKNTLKSMGFGQRLGKNGVRNLRRCSAPHKLSLNREEVLSYTGVRGFDLAVVYAAKRFGWFCAYEFDMPMVVGEMLLAGAYWEALLGAFTLSDVIEPHVAQRAFKIKLFHQCVESGAFIKSGNLYTVHPFISNLFNEWLTEHQKRVIEAAERFAASPPKRSGRKKPPKCMADVPDSQNFAPSENSLTAKIRNVERPKEKELFDKSKDSIFGLD